MQHILRIKVDSVTMARLMVLAKHERQTPAEYAADILKDDSDTYLSYLANELGDDTAEREYQEALAHLESK
jgi:hypothetical protein